MRPFDAAELFFYGTIRAFQYLRADTAFSEYKELVTDVMADLNHFVAYHKRRVANHLEQPDELRNALAAAEVLHSFVSGTLYPIRNGLLNKTHIELLNARLQEFETSLKLDLGALPIYVLEDKRAYSARGLLTVGARAVFSEEDQKLLPHLCLSDIDSAGKCLLHEQFTASGFHVLRALEAVVRPFFRIIIGKPAILNDDPDRPAGLGTLVNWLKTDLPDDEALAHLSRIVPYRNEIMHPETVLNENQAFDVFERAKLAIILMCAHARQRNVTLHIDWRKIS